MPRQRIYHTAASIIPTTMNIEQNSGNVETNNLGNKYFEEVKRIVLKRIEEIDLQFKTIKKGAVSYDKVDLLWDLQNECKNYIKQLDQYKLKHPYDLKMIDKLITDIRRLSSRMFNLSISSQWAEIIRQYKISIETSSQNESIHALSTSKEVTIEDDLSEVPEADLHREDAHEPQIATLYKFFLKHRIPVVISKPLLEVKETAEQNARLFVLQDQEVQDDIRLTITDHFEPEEQEQLELKTTRQTRADSIEQNIDEFDKQIEAERICIREEFNDVDEETSKEDIEAARNRVATIITPALEQLFRKISTIPQSSKRLQIALNLHEQLKALADTYYVKGDPRSESNKETFIESCNNLIDSAKPTLSKEPGWGEYLIILAKKLANAVIRCLTFGYKQAFFTIPENIPQALESFKRDAEIIDYEENNQFSEDIYEREISRLDK